MSTVDDGVATLELRAVSKAFGSVVALRSGTLRVRPGSIHALVGENGAGKSTLIKIAAGCTGATAARCCWAESPLTSGPPPGRRPPASR